VQAEGVRAGGRGEARSGRQRPAFDRRDRRNGRSPRQTRAASGDGCMSRPSHRPSQRRDVRARAVSGARVKSCDRETFARLAVRGSSSSGDAGCSGAGASTCARYGRARACARGCGPCIADPTSATPRDVTPTHRLPLRSRIDRGAQDALASALTGARAGLVAPASPSEVRRTQELGARESARLAAIADPMGSPRLRARGRSVPRKSRRNFWERVFRIPPTAVRQPPQPPKSP